MRLPTPPAAALLLFPAIASAASWNCERMLDGLKYDFKELRGKHEVYSTIVTHPTTQNTTWQVNPCAPIQKTKEEHPKDQCAAGTYVCGLVRSIDEKGASRLEQVIPVAGDVDGHKLSETVEKFSEPGEGGRKGVRVILNGGKYAGDDQRAVIDFVCDMKRTGLEGSKAVDTTDDSSGKDGKKKRRDEGKDKKDDEASLRFVNYRYHDKIGKKELQLEWRTRLACEEWIKAKDDADKSSSHWGFFTWVFILVFLGVAAYLIFGSWLNYNRYGARGWDLLPHSDTIRDIPYLLTDFLRRVGSTLQGRSTRGGYSAV